MSGMKSFGFSVTAVQGRCCSRSLLGATEQDLVPLLEEVEVVRGYCLAVRNALTDDGYPPLDAAGIRLHERLQAIVTSIARIEEKRGFLLNSPGSNTLFKLG